MSTSGDPIKYPEPVYSLFDTSREELPAVVVVNSALRQFLRRDFFPWHLSVLITPRALAEHGMPTREEYAILDRVCDEVDVAVTDDGNALFLARETWNGRRQLLFRVHDPEVADSSLQRLISRSSPQREWEFLMEHDAAWSFSEPYFSLLQGAEDDA